MPGSCTGLTFIFALLTASAGLTLSVVGSVIHVLPLPKLSSPPPIQTASQRAHATPSQSPVSGILVSGRQLCRRPCRNRAKIRVSWPAELGPSRCNSLNEVCNPDLLHEPCVPAVTSGGPSPRHSRNKLSKCLPRLDSLPLLQNRRDGPASRRAVSNSAPTSPLSSRSPSPHAPTSPAPTRPWLIARVSKALTPAKRIPRLSATRKNSTSLPLPLGCPMQRSLSASDIVSSARANEAARGYSLVRDSVPARPKNEFERMLKSVGV